MRVKRHTTGSVRFDKRRKTWSYLWWDGPNRRSKQIGTKQEYPTKAAAWAAVPEVRGTVKPQAETDAKGETVQEIAIKYEVERMPSRASTSRVYRSFLRCHVLPKWGSTNIRDIQPRPVEIWLRSLPLAPKSKTHVRSLLHALVEYAMWAGIIPAERNPISLVQNKGAMTKVREARSLTTEEFQALNKELREPFATLSLVSVCLGLRVSEALALRWSDVDWLGNRISVERSIVNQLVDDVKTTRSRKVLNLSSELMDRLRRWKMDTQFGDSDDWIFASPVQLGRKPYSYTGVWRELVRAANAAGIGHVATHAMRHTFRSWLDAVGTKVSVQQKMMRHSDIRTTMNIYGDVVTKEEVEAATGVSKLAFH